MNISLRWLFDHLENSSYNSIDLPQLLEKMSTTITEIESYQEVNIHLDDYTLIRIEEIIEQQQCIGLSKEFNQHLKLPFRNDLQKGALALCVRDGSHWRWATLHDVDQHHKDDLMPAVSCLPEEESGSWKKKIELSDYILTISNTSITHRPDLWGHRGFAREVGVLLNIPLKPERELLAPCAEKNSYSDQPIAVAIENVQACSRFSTMYCDSLSYQPSDIAIAFRLARIGARPINAIVDLTNYVMFDWGQPLHAFDAQAVGKSLQVTTTKDEVSLELLDGTTKQLPLGSLIIRNQKEILSLAGIMGGATSAVTDKTQAVFFESAHFDANLIRTISTQLHLRSEASARFEKGLDPAQTNVALARLAHIAQTIGLIDTIPTIISLGRVPNQKTIILENTYIEKLLGIALTPSFVTKTLQALGFGIYDEENSVYQITVPSWRAKDINLAIDIVEEIARFYGFAQLPASLPSLPLKPHSLQKNNEIRAIKNYCAFAGSAHELIQYPLLDEEFLRRIQWTPENQIKLKNPVSQNARLLTPSLIPSMLQGILENSTTHESEIRFFQMNPVWQMQNADPLEEQSLAGLFFNAQNEPDFYACKEFLDGLFALLKRPVVWQASTTSHPAWFHPYKTAELRINQTCIGYAGTINPVMLSKICDGFAFAFEIKSDVLLAIEPTISHFKPLAKYPDSWLDVSLLASTTLTIAALEKIIRNVDPRIFHVTLQDIFYKDEWLDKRSVLLRFFIRDNNRTLTKHEIDQLHTAVKLALEGHGAVIR